MRSEGYSTQFVCVCVSVNALTVTPLTYKYEVRYESKANVVLKVLTPEFYKNTMFKSYSVIRSHNELGLFRRPVDTSEDFLMTTGDYCVVYLLFLTPPYTTTIKYCSVFTDTILPTSPITQDGLRKCTNCAVICSYSVVHWAVMCR